jgi:alpha-beta hydrolase superfamily lysophospholipase
MGDWKLNMTNPEQVRKQPPAQLDSRVLAGGVDSNDYLSLKERCVLKGQDWVSVCEELGDRRSNLAKLELAKGHTQTAKYFFFAAQAVFRLGQYGIVELTDERLRLYHKLDDCFHAFAQLCSPPMEKVEIQYRDYKMEGWFIRPNGENESKSVVLMIPGATGFKEEFLSQAQNIVDRGLPVLLMDGPGQGTTLYFNKGYLEVRVEDSYKLMVDYLTQNRGFSSVGVIGGSTGGYYVTRAAAVDSRIKACVWNSGSYYPQEICKFAPIYHHKFALLFGVSDEKMKLIWPQMTLEGMTEKIHCPFLVVHSESDPIFSLEGARRAFEGVKSVDKELKIYPGTFHCQGGAESEAFRYMADWLVDRLQ